MQGTMKRKYAEKSNILLVNITRLGDMLQATPCIAGMKQENPNCKISVLVEKQFSAICHWLPNIDEVLTIDLGMIVRSLARGHEGVIDAYGNVSELVEDLRSRNFDYCLNMSSSAYTALLLKLVGVHRHGGWMSDEEGHRVIESDWAKLFATSVFHQNRQFNSINLVDVFRCSADVEQHPNSLLINIDRSATEYCEDLIREIGYTNTGPLIAVQAGASQGKRQWAPERFSQFMKILVEQHNARVVLTGTTKELPIIDQVVEGVNSPNVGVVAGKTDIPQLAALLKLSDILVTGDTGPMHIGVAAGTPIIAMFIASAYGFETGPYSEGNIVLQPVIGCGPCNPNKPCSRPDCHDHIDPVLLAEITMMRVKEDFKTLPAGFVDPSKLIVYRSHFDENGFCDFEALNSSEFDPWVDYRRAYRKLWMSDIAGYDVPENGDCSPGLLAVQKDGFEGLEEIVKCAEKGEALIDELVGYVTDLSAPPEALARVNDQMTELDREIEQIGFHLAPLGPLTRMFVFAKENIVGTEPLSLASQMRDNYKVLARRSKKLGAYYASGH